MFLKILITLILATNVTSTFAQSNPEHALVRANRIETKLREKGFIVLGHYVDGFVPVERQYKKSFVDSNGNYISVTEYTHVRDFSMGYASVKRNDGWTLINTKGEELFEPNKQFSGIGKVNNGIMIVTSKKVNNAGLARITGEVILPMQYAFINPLDSLSGNYLATVNGQFLLLDSLGNTLSENLYEDFSSEENSSCFAAKLEGHWGVLNLKGIPLTKFNLPYDFIEAFNNGSAVVRKNGKVGFINEQGVAIIPLIYDDAFAFNEFGHASVTIGNERAMIDSFGNIFLKGNYDLITQLDSNAYRIVDSESQFVVDKNSKQIWADKYYLIEPLAKHLYKVIPLTEPRLPFFANEAGKKIANYGG